jgi:hypothetical protein
MHFRSQKRRFSESKFPVLFVRELAWRLFGFRPFARAPRRRIMQKSLYLPLEQGIHGDRERFAAQHSQSQQSKRQVTARSGSGKSHGTASRSLRAAVSQSSREPRCPVILPIAPNGNPQPGPKFKYKLAWMKRLLALRKVAISRRPSAAC